MSRVFVVQTPARREAGRWVPKYDLSAAERFGELVPILGFGNVPSDPGPTRARLLDVLSDFSPAADYALLLGDPVAIAQVVHFLATSTSGAPFRVLKWDRRLEAYEPYIIG